MPPRGRAPRRGAAAHSAAAVALWYGRAAVTRASSMRLIVMGRPLKPRPTRLPRVDDHHQNLSGPATTRPTAFLRRLSIAWDLHECLRLVSCSDCRLTMGIGSLRHQTHEDRFAAALPRRRGRGLSGDAYFRKSLGVRGLIIVRTGQHRPEHAVADVRLVEESISRFDSAAAYASCTSSTMVRSFEGVPDGAQV